jgi:multimeric flavodoxin WrbA
MKALLIVYHTMTGGTRQMAEAAAAGARTEPALHVSLVRAQDAHADDLMAASGYIFATPENLASMSGQMKDFFDRLYYAALDRLNGRPYAAMICAGSDGRGAAQQIERIATGLRLKAVADALIVRTHAQSPEEILRAKIISRSHLQQCEALGATLATGIAMGIF